MFCTRCGADIGDNKFCQQCGTNIVSNTENKRFANVREKILDISYKMKKCNLINVKNALFVGISLLVLVILGIMISNHKVTVTMDKYISFEFEGYDTVGTCRVLFDEESFINDYQNKIKFNKKNIRKFLEDVNGECSTKEAKEFVEGLNAPKELIYNCVFGELDKKTGLSNGDTITYFWKCLDGEALRYFDVKLKYTDIELVVGDLIEVEELNPFNNVVVEYKNIAPYGTASVSNIATEEVYDDITFSINPSKDLSNGDEIVITVNLEMDEVEFIEKYGMRLSNKEMRMTVEGLDEYVFNRSDITDEALDRLKKHSEEVVKSLVDDECQDNNKNKNIKGTVNSITYVDDYFLAKSKALPDIEENIIQLVYKVDVTEEMTDSKTKRQEELDLTYYINVGYSNLIMNKDGEMNVDMAKYQLPTEEYIYDTGYTFSIFNLPLRYEYSGYETLDLFYEKCISDKLENYVCEK